VAAAGAEAAHRPQPVLGDTQPDATSPSVSADGRRIVYRSADRFLYSIRVRDTATGKDTALISSSTALFNPRISANSAVIAYSDRLGHLYSVSSSGGAIKRVCAECGTSMGISANGNLISFEPFKAEDLMYYDVARQAKVKVADRPANSVLTGGRFSPDGKWMAFHVRSRLTTAQVFVVRIDGALPVPREQWIPITDGQAEELEPAWSADGSVIYYLSDRDGFRCVWARRIDAAGKPAGDAFEAAPFHSARLSLRRRPGARESTGLTGLSAAPGRLVFAMSEATGDIWLVEK
jgi:Tol biopolymer transport system component